ncbi:hypothetical protein K7432_005967 [Basidiobolus ranarum]|uniref:Uncharacterized protein n=1 Tax=Basidiobolus ranarum TaxID=34480 RepID=A0ABR2WVS2_9FUNG
MDVIRMTTSLQHQWLHKPDSKMKATNSGQKLTKNLKQEPSKASTLNGTKSVFG